ncbi:MAG: phosphotyrosine protein phosphatase [Deltaproteobacteria bacterium]|nr:phosphotyrosine protein phosphatase [Deltaproteobacteria bacterium]
MPIRVCFVCLGNICRSPTADGVMVRLVADSGLADQVDVDSAGTSAFHVGEPADHRSAAVARGRGYALTSRSRPFVSADWNRFEYVLAMDRSNLRNLRRLPGAHGFTGTLALFRDFDPESPAESDTPDPYYGGADGFDEVLDICERGCRGLLEQIRSEHGL